jgi:hypothetical protein
MFSQLQKRAKVAGPFLYISEEEMAYVPRLTIGKAKKSSMALIESPEHSNHEARLHSALDEKG